MRSKLHKDGAAAPDGCRHNTGPVWLTPPAHPISIDAASGIDRNFANHRRSAPGPDQWCWHGLISRFVRFCGRQARCFIGGTGTPRPSLLLAPQKIVAQRLRRPLAARLGLPLRFVAWFELARFELA
jgi:hypothetical protein